MLTSFSEATKHEQWVGNRIRLGRPDVESYGTTNLPNNLYMAYDTVYNKHVPTDRKDIDQRKAALSHRKLTPKEIQDRMKDCAQQRTRIISSAQQPPRSARPAAPRFPYQTSCQQLPRQAPPTKPSFHPAGRTACSHPSSGMPAHPTGRS